MIKCNICMHESSKTGRCLKRDRGECCSFLPKDDKIINYAARKGISITDAIELWKFHLSHDGTNN